MESRFKSCTRFSHGEGGLSSSSSSSSVSVTEVSDRNGSNSSPNSPLKFENDPWMKNKTHKKKKQHQKVYLEGYVETSDEDELGRTKSLTDDDLEELKGCLDLGFGFSYDEIPELCNTLPALELCYSMNQKYLDEQQKTVSPAAAAAAAESLSDTSSASGSSPIANWKISSPGKHFSPLMFQILNP